MLSEYLKSSDLLIILHHSAVQTLFNGAHVCIQTIITPHFCHPLAGKHCRPADLFCAGGISWAKAASWLAIFASPEPSYGTGDFLGRQIWRSWDVKSAPKGTAGISGLIRVSLKWLCSWHVPAGSQALLCCSHTALWSPRSADSTPATFSLLPAELEGVTSLSLLLIFPF